MVQMLPTLMQVMRKTKKGNTIAPQLVNVSTLADSDNAKLLNNIREELLILQNRDDSWMHYANWTKTQPERL